jgi:hypothetical protein
LCAKGDESDERMLLGVHRAVVVWVLFVLDGVGKEDFTVLCIFYLVIGLEGLFSMC